MRESAIFNDHRTSVIQRIQQERVVLAIQRTTELNCPLQPMVSHSADGLEEFEIDSGSVSPSAALGDAQFCTTLAVTGAGQPLGLLDQQILSPVTAEPLAGMGYEEERLKWLMASSNRQLSLPQGSKVVAIANQSTAITKIFSAPREPGLHLLLRLHPQDDGGFSSADRLTAAIAQAPVAGHFSVSIKNDRSHGHRQARLAVSYSTMMLPREADLDVSTPGFKRDSAVPVTVLWAREPESSVRGDASAQRIDWCLVSDLPIHSFEQACLLIRWYSFRSLLRQYHSLLKSGLQIERLAEPGAVQDAGQGAVQGMGQAVGGQMLGRSVPGQPGLPLTAHGLRAWELLRLLQEAEAQPQTSCEALLRAEEWQALFCSIYRTSLPPRHAPSIRQALHWVVQLGGGLTQVPQEGSSQQLHCLWRGLRRLDALTQGVPQPA